MIAAEAMHAIIAHRRRGDPLTTEAGIVRVADALDMAQGRSRLPFESGRPNIHSLSAAAIEAVRIDPGEEKAVRIEIDMNNSAGIFQVDELLATKLRGSGPRGADRGHRADRRRARETPRPGLPDLALHYTEGHAPLDEVKERIEQALPGARAEVTDLTGGGDHLRAEVVYDGFAGLSRLEQHKLVYGVFEGEIGGPSTLYR